MSSEMNRIKELLLEHLGDDRRRTDLYVQCIRLNIPDRGDIPVPVEIYTSGVMARVVWRTMWKLCEVES